MIYDLKKILDIGEENGFAVPAFNVYNLETVMGVMQAAEETGAPVIFQMYSRLFDSQIAQYVAPIIRKAAEGVSKDYTKVEDAAKFVNETGVCALAVAVGTAHGHYKQAPVLALKRIEELHEGQKAHLVLHGGSGVPDDQIAAAVKAGIRKINFGTDVCCSLLDGIRAVDPSILALDLFMQGPTARVKDFAVSKIKLLGADK